MNKEWRNMLIFMVFFIVAILFIFLVNEKNQKGDEQSWTGNKTLNTEQEIKDEFSNNDNFHWTHMPITYYIENEKECGKIETEEIKIAFDRINKATNGTVTFAKINSSADIDINCSFIKDCYKLEIEAGGYYDLYTETICGHDLGRTEILNYSGNKILKAKIEFIGLAGFMETPNDSSQGLHDKSGFTMGQCDRALTETHEILHAFGYSHNEIPYSIMYPYSPENGGAYTANCLGIIKQERVDGWIVEDLIETYKK